MEENKNFEEIKNNTPKDIQIFVDKSFDIADEVDFILENQGKSRANLATDLRKNESEISKWLSGLHNLTIKSVAKIEASLGETVLTTPSKERAKYEEAIKKLEAKVARLTRKITQLENEKLHLLETVMGHYESSNADYIVSVEPTVVPSNIFLHTTDMIHGIMEESNKYKLFDKLSSLNTAAHLNKNNISDYNEGWVHAGIVVSSEEENIAS